MRELINVLLERPSPRIAPQSTSIIPTIKYGSMVIYSLIAPKSRDFAESVIYILSRGRAKVTTSKPSMAPTVAAHIAGTYMAFLSLSRFFAP